MITGINQFVYTEFVTAEGYRAVLIPLWDENIELRYYDCPSNDTYRSWLLSRQILNALISFWKSYRSGSRTIPVLERVPEGEFRMLSEKTVQLKEADPYGALKMTGADLSVDLIESLFFEFSGIRCQNKLVKT